MAMVITDNSPSAGYVAWSGVVMTFKSVDYNVTNGNSNKKYIWWDFTNPNVFQESDTLPTLTDDDCIYLLNLSGTHYLIPGATIYREELLSSSNGWMDAGETWTFSSVDDPTGIITVPAGALLKYSAGMKIKFVNGGNTIYGVITAVADTAITFLHQIDSTDSLALTLMADSAITLPYYSIVKSPFGFPMARSNWDLTAAVSLGQGSPVQDTWYAGGNITLPIGDWSLQINTDCNWVTGGGGAGAYNGSIYLTLSTANNTESDASSTRDMSGQVYEPAGYSWNWSGNLILLEDKTQAAKAIWYLNGKTANASVGSIGASGDIIARFNYI
jgi:hypothetical protein